jgi:hypothetical protein
VRLAQGGGHVIGTIEVGDRRRELRLSPQQDVFGAAEEEAEVIRKAGVGAGDGLAARQVLGLERVPIGRQNELRLGSGSRRAGLQGGEGFRDLAGDGDGDMDVVRLKDAAQV